MQKPLDVGGRGRTRIRLGSGALDRCGCDPRQVILGNAEAAQPLETAEPRELLDVDAHLLAEPAHGVWRYLLVERKRLRERQGIHRPVWEPVAAAERLRHRMPEREHR